MAFPINIENLVNSRTVESVRIEFKEGWNPEPVVRTVCAFANDIDEYGGGYLIVGIGEKDGVPILPPKGLQQSQLDSIQKEFVELCHKIQPNVFPLIEPVEFQGTHIIVIWVTTGEERPYTAPSTLGQKAQRRIYIRSGAVTLPASEVQERRLRELAVNKHFDDRMNLGASVNDLDLGIISSYLQEVKSDLFDDVSRVPLEDLCLKMQIARGPKENIRPLNVGLMLFSRQPEQYFAGCITNLVEFDDESGTSYSNKEFKGPVQSQIRDVMDHLQANVIKQHTTKDPLTAEAQIFFNYPYQAIEEVVANAMYHRSYENPTPNEIRIHKRGTDQTGADSRRIEIVSYPGPLPPVDEDALARLDVQARNYRNIRLGDFLKNLRLVEKFATGIPTIVKALKDNGSPAPILSTDADRSVFRAVLRIHPDTPDDTSRVSPEADLIQLTDLQQSIIESLFNEPTTEGELAKKFKGDIHREILLMVERGLLGVKTVRSGFVFRKEVVFYHVTRKGVAALKSSF